MELRKKFENLFLTLNKNFLERKEVISTIIIALPVDTNILLLGPPGTAKSQIARDICYAFGLKRRELFMMLLTKFTRYEEMFGAPTLESLKLGKIERNPEGMIQESKLAFLDEVFKANSAILNSLLTLLNERKYKEGSKWYESEIKFVIGASNELPEDERLAALDDRFIMRFFVDRLSKEGRQKLIDLKRQEISKVIDVSDLGNARDQIDQVSISDETKLSLDNVLTKLEEKGFCISDRTFRKSLDLFKSRAWLKNRISTDKEDVLLLKHVVWKDFSQIKEVAQIIEKNLDDLALILEDLNSQSEEIYEEAIRKHKTEGSSYPVDQAINNLKRIEDDLKSLEQKTGKSTRISLARNNIVDKINYLIKNVINIDINYGG